MKQKLHQEAITTEEELRSLLGVPGEIVRNKAIRHLDAHCRDFIARSPMLFLATSDAAGLCDVSPRGDAAGFVLVMDDHHLVIPERPGNRRMDSLRNILANPGAGLIFIIPGLEETLRVNGKAAIIKDRHIMERMESHGKVPVVGICVAVEECYIHCAKAFKRSGLWYPATWPAPEDRPKVSAILVDHTRKLQLTEEQIAAALKDSYEHRLY